MKYLCLLLPLSGIFCSKSLGRSPLRPGGLEGLLHQPLSKRVGVLQVHGEVLVAIAALVLFREEVEVVARVVVKLICVAPLAARILHRCQVLGCDRCASESILGDL